MGTPAMFSIVDVDYEGDLPVVVRHHCDGHPECMLPLIAKAFHAACERRFVSLMHRRGYIGSLLCSTDAFGFTVENHWDDAPMPMIDWLYEITGSLRPSEWSIIVKGPFDPLAFPGVSGADLQALGVVRLTYNHTDGQGYFTCHENGEKRKLSASGKQLVAEFRRTFMQ